MVDKTISIYSSQELPLTIEAIAVAPSQFVTSANEQGKLTRCNHDFDYGG
jgi:hypothetical protein